MYQNKHVLVFFLHFDFEVYYQLIKDKNNLIFLLDIPQRNKQSLPIM